MKYLRYIVFITALIAVLSSGTLIAEELIHVVGKGETIYSISRSYQISPEELMRINGITDPSKLQAGKPLVIHSAAASANTPALTDYKIVKGDTLYSIAQTHGIALQALLDINKFSSNQVIKPGDRIKVPLRETAKTVQGKPGTKADTKTDAKTDVLIQKDALDNLRWPVNPREISYMTGQLGVVLHGEHFESVTSLTQGKVISAGPWRKFGKVAIVEVSGGYYYMYGGCETLSVKVGDTIGPGMELGKLGINTVSEKPQLFFMVFRSNTPIDPAKAPRAMGNVRT